MTANSVEEHRQASPTTLRIAVLTISDSRTEQNDTSGDLMVALAVGSGHAIVDRRILKDEPELLRETLRHFHEQKDVQAVLITGGTGISPRDQTYEAVASLLTKQLPGYGELFRLLSYQEIGPAAMLSRAIGGIFDHMAVLVTPGSRAAVELAMTKLILPELPHIVREANRRS